MAKNVCGVGCAPIEPQNLYTKGNSDPSIIPKISMYPN